MEGKKVKLYAIGDVHGCLGALNRLLEKIDRDAGADPCKVVFLGDYTDRGPDSYGVVKRLDGLRLTATPDRQYVFIRGNHDVMFMDWVRQQDLGYVFRGNGGDETMESYALAGAEMREHMPFFDHTVWWHRDGDFMFVHAGMVPSTPIEDHSEHDLVWNRDWNDYDGEFHDGVFVVHGHTPTKSVDVHKNQVNIDTGCVFGRSWSEEYGRLTAVRLDSRDDIKFIQSREKEPW